MPEPIKLGDLVIVVRGRPCCNEASTVGFIYKVGKILFNREGWCDHCNGIIKDHWYGYRTKPHEWWGYTAHEIQRIPPLDPKETQHVQTPVTVT